MQYRIVQCRTVEPDEDREYSVEQLEAHRRYPATSKVVWQGDCDKDFGEKVLRYPTWYPDADWPSTEQDGLFSYSYRLERYDEETQTWQDICHVEPVCEL